MSTVERRESVNVLRLRRFKAGETADEIAQSEGVRVDTVLYGLRRAEERKQMLFMWKLMDLRLEGAIENERIRKRIRRDLSEKLIKAVDCLLSGKRAVIARNPNTGEIIVHDTIDPEVIAMGVEQARTLLSLEEKPAPNPIYVNIQNNAGDSAEGRTDKDWSYEERIDRIRQEKGFSTGKPALGLPSGTDPAEG